MAAYLIERQPRYQVHHRNEHTNTELASALTYFH